MSEIAHDSNQEPEIAEPTASDQELLSETPEQKFADHVAHVQESGDATRTLYTPVTSLIVGEQAAIAISNGLLGAGSLVAGGIAMTGVAMGAGMVYANRNTPRRALIEQLRDATQEEVGARYELYREKNPEYSRKHQKDEHDEEIPKHTVVMHYYGSHKRGSITTISDVQRMMTLAKENDIATVHMPAELAADLDIPAPESSTDATTGDYMRHKKVRLSRVTSVRDTPEHTGTPDEWLAAVEKADKGLGIESILLTMSQLNPVDPLVRAWKQYKDVASSEEDKGIMYASLYSQLRASLERQLHDTEIDSAGLREAMHNGENIDRSQFVSHLRGEVRNGRVHWRSQNGQETDVTALKNALGLAKYDEAALGKMLKEPLADPVTTQRAAEYALFAALHKRFKGSSQHELGDKGLIEPMSVFDHHKGTLQPLAEDLRKTREGLRGKPLAVKIGAFLLGTSIIVLPSGVLALTSESHGSDHGLSSAGYAESSTIGNISGNSKNKLLWDIDEHNVEAAGYWTMATSNDLHVRSENGGSIDWQSMFTVNAAQFEAPTTLPATVTNYIKVDHELAVDDIVINQGNSEWGMRIPVREGMSVAAASIGGDPATVQYQQDGAVWLHEQGAYPKDSKDVTYWLTPDANAPKPKAIADIHITNTDNSADIYPTAVIDEHLPQDVKKGDPAVDLQRYITSNWNYDLRPLPQLEKGKVLESFVIKALAARKANCNVANTLEALYDYKEQRAVATGYGVGQNDTAIYSHAAHMWTVDASGAILDATPHKGAQKFDSYFAPGNENDGWDGEKVSQLVMIGAFGLSGLVMGVAAGRPMVRKWRYERASGKLQRVHTSIDVDQTRRALSVLDQLLYAPTFDLSQARRYAERSQKTGANLISIPNGVLLSDHTEAALKAQRDTLTEPDDIAYIDAALATVYAARKTATKRDALAARAAELHKKVKK